jgi:histidinol phosphatase-like PHP family hydrolase
MSEFRLLLIADSHAYTSPQEESPPPRQSLGGAELVVRAIQATRAGGDIDAIILLGDLLNDGLQGASEQTLGQLKAALDKFAANVPLLVVPGNHDGPADRILRVFGQTPGARQIGPYRFYLFVDRYGEGDFATRSGIERAAFLKWAEQPGGPIVAIQHNPMNPLIAGDYPYMLTNREQVMEDYEKAGVLLSLSGHFHEGQPLSRASGVNYYTCPALCEEPFGFALALLDGQQVRIQPMRLAWGPELPLVDYHCHTEFAYCGEGITAQEIIQRGRLMGLAGLCLVEHAPQLYCSQDDFWNARHISQPAVWRNADRTRMLQFRHRMEGLRSDFVRIGLEVECDAQGQLTLHEDDRWVDLLVGAVHWIPEDPAKLSDEQLAQAFLRTTQGLLDGGVDILAHPWRLFSRGKRTVPKELYGQLADMLARTGVAAEINFHKNENDPAFFTECIRRGVKIAFGSDTHMLHQTGALAAHLNCLQQAAGTSDPQRLRELML